MSILDSILVALFCWAVVFVVLAGLFGFIRVFSSGLSTIASKDSARKAEKPVNVSAAAAPILSTEPVGTEADFSAGDLKLKNVDEKTAAMIMAIVSDESGIPLSELCFRSIKEITAEQI